MSKNESNSQPYDPAGNTAPERNKSLTCQRTKAIHNGFWAPNTEANSGTNLLHVKERKQFTTGIATISISFTAEQISYMSKNESNSQQNVVLSAHIHERNKSLTCQRTKAIPHWREFPIQCAPFQSLQPSMPPIVNPLQHHPFTFAP